MARNTALIETAAFFPDGSEFKSLIADIFDVDDFSKYRSLSVPKTRFLVNETEIGDGLPIKMERPPERETEPVEQENPKSKIASDDDAAHALNDLAENIRRLEQRNAAIADYVKLLAEALDELRNNSKFNLKNISRRVLESLLLALIMAAIGFIYSKITPDDMPSSQPTGHIVATRDSDLNIRSTPNANRSDNFIGSLKNGTPVFVIGESGDFLELDCEAIPNIDADKCFAHRDYLKKY